MSGNTYVNKKCAGCDYTMRQVSTRTVWCKLCVRARFLSKMASPEVRSTMRRAQFTQDCECVAALVDAELSQPTRYWEI